MSMTSMTIRDLEESLIVALKMRATKHGWSMEEEVLDILRSVLDGESVTREPLVQTLSSEPGTEGRS